jgi:hypothetical protein
MRFGWSLFSGSVRPVLVVVPLVLGEHLVRLRLIEDHDVIADLGRRVLMTRSQCAFIHGA